MATIEDQTRNKIRENETALFELRKDSVKYLTFNSSGKAPVFDLQYMDEIRAVQGKEKTHIATILRLQDTLEYAAAAVRGLAGVHHEQPFTTSTARRDELQKELETLERDIALYERKTAHNEPYIDTHEFKQRKKECEQKMKELKPELAKVKKARETVEKLFQQAGVTV